MLNLVSTWQTLEQERVTRTVFAGLSRAMDKAIIEQFFPKDLAILHQIEPRRVAKRYLPLIEC